MSTDKYTPMTTEEARKAYSQSLKYKPGELKQATRASDAVKGMRMGDRRDTDSSTLAAISKAAREGENIPDCPPPPPGYLVRWNSKTREWELVKKG